MTLTIDLTLEEANRLEQIAKARGVDKTTLVRRWIADLNLTQETERPATLRTPEESANAFLAWAEGHSHNSPLLSDEAISRESIYGDQD